MQLIKNVYEGASNFLMQNNTDWIDINCGDERAGKTTLSFIKCKLANPNFSIDDVTLGLDEFIKRLDTAPRGSAVLCDEGGDAFLSRLALSRPRVKVLQQFMKIGEKNYFICINISDIGLLEKYLKNHRLRTLTKVKTRYKNGVLTRGICEFYTKKQAKRIRKTVEGNIKFPKPVDVDIFQAFPENDPLWIAYKQKKNAYLKIKEKEREAEDIVIEVMKPYGGMIVSRKRVILEIAKKKKITTRQARNILKEAIEKGIVSLINRRKVKYGK
ncbi:MAG: hypothetical protein Sv326_1329 (plasmid) [Candidatus Fermentimicrarchaeum limneticum]|uniref:Zona occludens toxin N-terminal domain-containing protein n=1 Tax=Fermentimicrarchaeum limneticum TaxID=2795018 RepID=A0A7D6BVN3_FERL1|nr:MAG: hypothetical protein Sv326_1329 [Candidatus Fermentimicrarchaeum limneticum]